MCTVPHALTALEHSHRSLSVVPLPKDPATAEAWSLDGHQDFTVVRFNKLVPGLLRYGLVHKKLCFSLPDI